MDILNRGLEKIPHTIEDCGGQQLRRKPDSILDTLTEKKARLQAQLQDVEAAIEALTKNPDFVKCLELLAKA